MDNPGEIMRLCRLCLVKDQVNIPIFDEQGDIRQIFLKISSCLPVKVSREDPLPKSICDGCSNKLDLLYEFRNTSANAEKTLLSWVGQADAKDVDETVTAAAHQVAKPSETQVKQEEVEESNPAPVQDIESMDAQESATFDESSAKDEEEEEPPPPKRARRTAAVKAQINIAPDSDDEDDDDDDLDGAEPMTKIEDESEESDDDKDPSYQDVPGTSADDQPGPSGVGKDGVEAPNNESTTWAIFQCSRCLAYFESHAMLVDHVGKCAFLPTSTITAFVKTEPTEFTGDYACPVCNKTFELKRYLTKHLDYVHNFAPVPCPMCSKTFRKDTLRLHINTVHKGLGDYFQCDICGESLKGKGGLARHKNALHYSNFNVHCDLCGKGFLYESNLTVHKKQSHDKEVTLHPCTEEGCTKIFKTKGSLQYHIDASHAKERLELICEQCGKIFTHPYIYKKHLRSHRNGPIMYTCKICGKALTTSGSYQDHMRAHTGERPFICEVCGTGFHSMKHLRCHKVVHTKEKPFGCRMCEKKFSQRTPLRLHVQKCHSEVMEAQS